VISVRPNNPLRVASFPALRFVYQQKVWLDRRFIDRLLALGAPGESYSDVIIRVAKANAMSPLLRPR
jgi:hypothetical protein